MCFDIYQVDSFTNRAYYGNPAAVCILGNPAEEEWMQKVAMEMNLSETAFLYPYKDGYNLRWFTPKVEVDLCGHATLASAHILWETKEIHETDEAIFYTKSGILTAVKNGDWIVMNFPAEVEQKSTVPDMLEEALGLKPLYVGKNRMDYLVEVESEEVVINLKPDFNKLAEITARGFIVTSSSRNKDYDFVSRFFAPSTGVNEDPVTGSAHCCLGPFWAERLNKKELIGYQASERGGTVKVRVDNDRVFLGGQCVTTLKGIIIF